MRFYHADHTAEAPVESVLADSTAARMLPDTVSLAAEMEARLARWYHRSTARRIPAHAVAVSHIRSLAACDLFQGAEATQGNPALHLVVRPTSSTTAFQRPITSNRRIDA